MQRMAGTIGVMSGLMLFAAGCAHENAAMSPVAQNQTTSERALARASDAQKKASAAQSQAEKAQADVERLKSELAQAQSKAAQDRQFAHQAQQDAMRENQKAQEQVASAQQAAIQNQQQMARSHERATTSITGTIAQAGSNYLLINRGADTPLRLQVNDSTVVMLNGQPAGPNELSEGTQVRASYVPGTNLPVATRIDAGYSDNSGVGGSNTSGNPGNY